MTERARHHSEAYSEQIVMELESSAGNLPRYMVRGTRAARGRARWSRPMEPSTAPSNGSAEPLTAPSDRWSSIDHDD